MSCNLISRFAQPFLFIFVSSILLSCSHPKPKTDFLIETKGYVENMDSTGLLLLQTEDGPLKLQFNNAHISGGMFGFHDSIVVNYIRQEGEIHEASVIRTLPRADRIIIINDSIMQKYIGGHKSVITE